jgi:hypothetical protein
MEILSFMQSYKLACQLLKHNSGLNKIRIWSIPFIFYTKQMHCTMILI